MTPVSAIEIHEFLESARVAPVIDVRSPSEYQKGHIPGASSLPLFDDEERALVGTLYHRHGNKVALLKGLDLVGPKMSSFVRQARKIAPEGKILAYCWRGGMRSESMAWLLQLAGIDTLVLKGGYKSYRRHIHELLTRRLPLRILGGMTGSGKTDVLLALQNLGQQVIDLERLAHHKGSVFGGLGQDTQPTTEHFENLLAQELLDLDLSKPIWLEDESLNVGHVAIPMIFYELMQRSPMLMMDVPLEVRRDRLVKEYGDFDKEILKALIEKISRRLGAVNARNASEALDNGNLALSIEIVLKYYDQAYLHKIETRTTNNIVRITVDPSNPEAAAALITKSALKEGLI